MAACRVAGRCRGGGPGGGAGGSRLGTGNGYVDARDVARPPGRVPALRHRGARPPTSPTNVLAHLTRAERDRRFRFDAATIGPDDFAAVFAKIDAFRDTSDFDMMQLIALWYGPPPRARRRAARRRSSSASLGFRYWFTDPLPDGVVDDKWFWSREPPHHLPHPRVPGRPGAARTRRSPSPASTGAEHAARGRARIEAWLDEKARFGFTEWHSDVYYQEDIEALTLLAEHAELDIARRAAAMLDLFLYDLALHQLQGQQRRHPRPVVHEGQEQGHRPGRLRGRPSCSSATHEPPYTSTVRHRRHVARRRRPLPAARGHPAGRPQPARPSSTASTWARRSTSTSRSAPTRRRRPRRRLRRPGRHPVLVGARRAHRLAGRAAHPRHDRGAQPLGDRAVPAVQAPGRHRRRRPRRGPVSSPTPCAA